MYKLPDEFLWGASTASHQVEGGTRNQWSEWEQANADDLAATAEHRLGCLPSWPNIRTKATDPANYISGDGVSHYERYEEDFDILQQLGLNSYRFGIEWARLQPSEDTWDELEIGHYRTYIAALKKRGIEPVVTLWHWTMPTWFAAKGGFKARANLEYFDRYAERIAQEFGPDMKYVITLNEPNVYTGFSYMTGEWPPQEKNPVSFIRVYWNLTRAHRRAYDILKSLHPHLQVGIAAQLGNMQPKRPRSVVDRLCARLFAYANNWWFLNRIRKHQDFIGLNYYFTNYFKRFRQVNPANPVNDLGWYMEPAGVGRLLQDTHTRYKKPIMITENGLADAKDRYRQWWLAETLEAVALARNQGVEVVGYLHWSLLDNFEWKYGWWPKFGLVAVDRGKGMKRTVRPSALWLRNYIRAQKTD